MAAVRPPFVGRRDELTRLQDLVGSAVAGHAAGVLVAGDAGVGKTSLIGELGRRAAGAGMLVLVGRCVDLGAGGLPYLPFAEALSNLVRTGDAAGEGPEAAAAAVVRDVAEHRPELNRLAGRSADLPADRAPGDSGLDRLALFESVTTVLARVAADVAPVLLVLEDLHWADSSTRDLVRFQLARLDSERLLVVGTYRSDDLHRRHPLRPLLAELVRLPRVERIEVSPFAGDELTEFLTAVNGTALPGEVVADISRRSAGNAYFAEELVAAGSGRLPAALADVLLDRLERLSPETQHVVKAASVIGASRIDDRLLRSIATGDQLPAAALDDAIRAAVAHHVLEPEPGDRWTFRHALLQEAVYVDLLPAERVRLHGALARQLAATGDPESSAAEWARHALAAHDLPQALDASLAAATAARRRLAPAEALEHYEQALQLWEAVGHLRPERPCDVVDVGLAAARAASDAGQHERAIALTQAALDETVAAGDARRAAGIRSWLALHLYAAEDRIEESRAVARQAAAELAEPCAERVAAWAVEARVDVSLGEPEAADTVIGPALAEARQLGLLSIEADLLVSLHSVDAQLGRPGDERHLAAAREVAERAGDWVAVLRVSYNVALNRWEAGDGAAALTAIGEAVAIAERAGLGSSLYATQCRWLHVTVLWMTGQPEAALAAVEAGRRQLPGPQAQAMALAGLQVHVARDPARALALAAGMDVGDAPWDVASRLSLEAEALILLGRPAEAQRKGREALELLHAHGEPYLIAGLWMAATALEATADLAEAARLRNDDAAVARHVEEGAAFAADGRDRAAKGKPRRRTLGPEGRAWVLRLEAEHLRLLGDPDPEPWRAAVHEFGFAAYEQAVVRRRLAERLLAAGDRDGAREEAAAALEAARRLGAAPLRQAVEDLARRGRLSLAGTGGPAGALTPRERDVMRLVARGLTNRQIGEQLFISEKTASVHISNVLAKLDVSGRTEAVAVAARRGLLD